MRPLDRVPADSADMADTQTPQRMCRGHAADTADMAPQVSYPVFRSSIFLFYLSHWINCFLHCRILDRSHPWPFCRNLGFTAILLSHVFPSTLSLSEMFLLSALNHHVFVKLLFFAPSSFQSDVLFLASSWMFDRSVFFRHTLVRQLKVVRS